MNCSNMIVLTLFLSQNIALKNNYYHILLTSPTFLFDMLRERDEENRSSKILKIAAMPMLHNYHSGPSDAIRF